ncbi:uncharacterized protein N7500_000483 [Penicillium coprophilum]|uniref:uncharacterized protein n=1 Tax=Penicillium coprophilum TaxID=36646 RepID=UPI00238717D3|nr:uncharacterized protein N7500_000483 [Penicillium coprophilum]KAJ5177784.1 hypothetical protein N7500_000483 [Penicillium coprophilum]
MPSGYDCSGPRSPISVDNDITGSGVIANYVATAGFAVLLIIIYFLVIYDPALDPFRKTDQDPLYQSFRPNPVDDLVLRTVRHIPKQLLGARKVRINSQVEKCFIECIIAMSDLQIVTGLSILISGYAQLHRGLSSYHWMVIVDLAWFSSLTHLACLTILRNYLYNHSRQRMWRLLCMAVLVILLTVALSFTGGYDWTSGYLDYLDIQGVLSIIDPAMCHLSSNSRSSMAYYAMIVSILLIVFGFVARIIKLHKTISVDVWGKYRVKLSIQSRRVLSIAFTWCCSTSPRKSLKNTLLYRPLLTMFLLGRIFLDGWSSISLEGPDEGDNNWGFGQVVALVLLVAPLITIMKYFTHGTPHTFFAKIFDPDDINGIYLDNQEIPAVVTSCSDDTIHRESYFESQIIRLTASPFRHEPPRRRDDPNSDWNDHTQTLGAVIIYLMLMCCVILLFVCTLYNKGNVLENLLSHYSIVIMAFIGLWGVALFSLTIELDLCRLSLRSRRFLHFVNILFFLSSAIISAVMFFPYFCAYGAAAAFYILCVVLYRILGSTS